MQPVDELNELQKMEWLWYTFGGIESTPKGEKVMS